MNPALPPYLNELVQNTDVLGVILFGSWARGNAQPGSDVDLVVILRQGFRRAVEYRDEQAFEIIWVTEQGALDFWQAHPDDAVDLWSVAQVLLDRDGSVARLQAAADVIRQQGKPLLSPEQLAHIRFDVAERPDPAFDGVVLRYPTTVDTAAQAAVGGSAAFASRTAHAGEPILRRGYAITPAGAGTNHRRTGAGAIGGLNEPSGGP